MSTRRKLERRRKRKINEQFNKAIDEMLLPEVINHKLGDAPMREYIEAHNEMIRNLGFTEEKTPDMFFNPDGTRKGRVQDDEDQEA